MLIPSHLAITIWPVKLAQILTLIFLLLTHQLWGQNVHLLPQISHPLYPPPHISYRQIWICGHGKLKDPITFCWMRGSTEISSLSYLLILHLFPLGKVISRLRISFYCYADDTQLYCIWTLILSSSSSTTLPTLAACLKIKAWMNHNFLQLNSSKTEAIHIGFSHQIRTSTITRIIFSGQDSFITSGI